MSFFQNIYGVLFRPNDTFKSLAVNYSPSVFLQAFLVLILVNVIRESLNFGSVLSSIISWFFFTCLFFLIAYVFVLSGKDFWKTLSVLAFANLPLVFLAPLQILNLTNPIIAMILKLGISLWVLNLNLIAISELCSIPKKKTILLYLIPPLIVLFLFISTLVKLITQIIVIL